MTREDESVLTGDVPRKPIPNNFAKRLRELREERELGVNELAKMAGLSQGTVSRWENESRAPKWEHVQKVARAIGARLEYLRSGTPPKWEAPPRPNLDRVLREAKLGRWSEDTIAAARRRAGEDRPVTVWLVLLDRIERALRGIDE